MFRYLKAAFWTGMSVPLLGVVPVNALCALAGAVLGFFEPALWLIFGGLEISYLMALSTNRRFQRVTDAVLSAARAEDTEAKRMSLVAQLPEGDRKQLALLEQRCQKVNDMTRSAQPEMPDDANREALRKLTWMYLKLLMARHYLRTLDVPTLQTDIVRKISQIQSDLKSPQLADPVRESKQATLVILQKRLANIQRREQTLQEVESDLTRIDAQIDLSLENATMRNQPQVVAGNIDLFSQLLDAGAFGDSGADVAALDRAFAPARDAVAQ